VADPAASASSSPRSSLANKRIVITRGALQSSKLFEKLLERQAIPRSLPLVAFSSPVDNGPLDAALSRWQKQEFDWALFTSANAVHSVVSRSATLGLFLDQPGGLSSIAAVGPATAEAVAEAGLVVDYVAKTHLGVGMAEELAPRLRDKAVFLPRSDRANPDLPLALQRIGAKLTEVVAYRTLPPADVDRERVRAIANGHADAVLFFSPTAVHNFADLLGKKLLTNLQNKIAFAAVGPVTSAALHEYGIERIVMAADTTTNAVIDALETYFGAQTAAHQPAEGAKHG
jgi:uroporphyrinogen III methyltransferase/synthase